MQQSTLFPEAQSLLLRELPAAEQPLSRVQRVGIMQLSAMELLALAIGGSSGLDTAARLLTRFTSLHELLQAPLSSLEKVEGIGSATAIRLQATLEMARRITGESWTERPKVTCPADGANLLMAEMQYLLQEELRVIILNTRNDVLAVPTIYRGSLNTSVVRIAEVFRPAIEANAAAIIVVHNHPSGDPTPSPEDVRVTREMIRAGALLSITLLDHLIIGKQKFVSLKERGMGIDF